MIRNASVAQVYWLLKLTGIIVILLVHFWIPVCWRACRKSRFWSKSVDMALYWTKSRNTDLHYMFVLHNKGFYFIIAGGNYRVLSWDLDLFFLINRNPLPHFFSTSKEESLTMLTAPSPQCPGPGETARETHLMLRYSIKWCMLTHDVIKTFQKVTFFDFKMVNF